MAKSASFTHVVNGYSRYDVPHSLAASITPGILYPARIDFINARDRVTIEQGVDVRSNPLAVPTFNPYTFRLHRFWVPFQLYHPEMRTNSSKFDMNNLSLNWLPYSIRRSYKNVATNSFYGDFLPAYSNSLFSWLRFGVRTPFIFTTDSQHNAFVQSVSISGSYPETSWVNCDTYLAYWDIVRNFYGYSQWRLFSFAWPASWYISQTSAGYNFNYQKESSFFAQRYGNLEFLDAFFESQFYPAAVNSSNGTFNRLNLAYQIVNSDLIAGSSVTGDGYPVAGLTNSFPTGNHPRYQFDLQGATNEEVMDTSTIFALAHPMAVVPSSPDRFSRLIPVGPQSDVSMAGVTSIPQLAIASRLQEYKDLLGAGGSRYTDWLDTFFASKISHVDRPKLLFSASQMVNAQIVMNQSGQNNFEGSQPLGAMGGAIAFNTQLGRVQTYYFEEPGYMIDMISIRPVYYWAEVRPDYLNYRGADYFNPIYNDIGYQSVPNYRLFANTTTVVEIAQEPCFNEFRSSYDEVLGQLNATFGPVDGKPLYSYWVQQRSSTFAEITQSSYYRSLFVDLNQVNSPFKSNVEDNFFINMSWSVKKKNLVNKTFATRLSNR